MTKRNPALDVFRGLTILLMILVNSLPKSPKIPILQHAVWNGCNLADIVFPFFLIIVGFTNVIRFSDPKQQMLGHAFQRSIELFSIGLFINAFPFFTTLRIPGVLQRIAVCYLVIAILHRYLKPSLQLLILIFILISYWLFNQYFPTTEFGHLTPFCRINHIGCFDNYVLTGHHLRTAYFDTEGILSTYPAIATTIFGSLIGYRLIHHPKYFSLWLLVLGLLSVFAAYEWQPWCPINKPIWSSSFVLLTGGLACLTYDLLMLIRPYAFFKSCLSPLEWLGQHSLTIYILHVLGLKLLYAIHLPQQKISLAHYIISTLNHYLSALHSSLVFASCYTLLWFLPLILKRSKISQ